MTFEIIVGVLVVCMVLLMFAIIRDSKKREEAAFREFEKQFHLRALERENQRELRKQR